MAEQLTPETERENDVVASLAVTLDSYVCRLDGAVDYLDKYPMADFDFDAWANRVGALAMGRTTYEQTIGWGWTWGDRPNAGSDYSNRLAGARGGKRHFQGGTDGECHRRMVSTNTEETLGVWRGQGGHRRAVGGRSGHARHHGYA